MRYSLSPQTSFQVTVTPVPMQSVAMTPVGVGGTVERTPPDDTTCSKMLEPLVHVTSAPPLAAEAMLVCVWSPVAALKIVPFATQPGAGLPFGRRLIAYTSSLPERRSLQLEMKPKASSPTTEISHFKPRTPQ